jgi:hypothetical protein
MTDLWVVNFDWPGSTGNVSLPDLVSSPDELQLLRAVDGGRGRAYRSARSAPGAAWQRLVCIQDVVGASPELHPTHHYVVETDAVPEHEDDFDAWYRTEHLPGLAACPGVVHAWRYRRDAERPRWYACYDLASPEVFGSPAWLAVRHTPWSDRVRPHFRNTIRTMFKRVTVAVPN